MLKKILKLAHGKCNEICWIRNFDALCEIHLHNKIIYTLRVCVYLCLNARPTIIYP